MARCRLSYQVLVRKKFMAPNGAPASETLLLNLKTTNDKSRESIIISCPRCISCTHWMLMESGSTLSTRFAASCRNAHLYLY